MAIPRPPLPSTTAIPLPRSPCAYWLDDSSAPGASRGSVMDAPLDLKPFVKYFIAPIIMLALTLLVFYFLHLPPVIVKSHVTHASHTEFNFIQSSNDTISLHYDLAFNITFRNPNRRYGIYYDNIDVMAYYKLSQMTTTTTTSTWFCFGMANLNSDFYQGHKTITLLTPSFKGQHEVPATSFITKDNFDIVVKLYIRNKYYWPATKFTSWKANSKITCDLKFPFIGANAGISDGPSAANTECKDLDTSLCTPVSIALCWIILISLVPVCWNSVSLCAYFCISALGLVILFVI